MPTNTVVPGSGTALALKLSNPPAPSAWNVRKAAQTEESLAISALVKLTELMLEEAPGVSPSVPKSRTKALP
jgi:hypothetical protein